MNATRLAFLFVGIGVALAAGNFSAHAQPEPQTVQGKCCKALGGKFDPAKKMYVGCPKDKFAACVKAGGLIAPSAGGEDTCSKRNSACVAGEKSRRAYVAGQSSCDRAFAACMQTGVWDTTSAGRFGRRVEGIAKR
jgi:hypothetical protein